MNFKSPVELYNYLKNNIKYRMPESSEDPILSPSEVMDIKKGHCHEQTFLISKELSKMGIDNKKWFIYATNKNGNYVDGNVGTHSIVEFKYNGKICVIENAFERIRGFHKFNNDDDLDMFYSSRFVAFAPRGTTNCRWKTLKGHPGMGLWDFCELNINSK